VDTPTPTYAEGGGSKGDTAKRGSGDGSEAAHGADEHELVPEADADVVEELHLDTLGLLEQVLELCDAIADAVERACADGRRWSERNVSAMLLVEIIPGAAVSDAHTSPNAMVGSAAYAWCYSRHAEGSVKRGRGKICMYVVADVTVRDDVADDLAESTDHMLLVKCSGEDVCGLDSVLQR